MGKIGRIEWNPTLSIGIEDIDSDHKGLIDFYNQIVSSVDDGVDILRILEELSFMCRYIILHFDREEMYMRSIDYPALSSHIATHDLLSRCFSLRYESLMHHRRIKDLHEMVDFIGTWLTEHIQNDDVAIGVFARSLRTAA